MPIHFLTGLGIGAAVLAAGAAFIVYRTFGGVARDLHRATAPDSLFKNADLTKGRWAVVYTDDKGNAKILDDSKILQKTGDTIHLYFDWQNFVPVGMPPPSFSLQILHDDRLFYAGKVLRAEKINLGDAAPFFVEALSCRGVVAKDQLPHIRAKLAAAEIYGAAPDEESLRFDRRFTIFLPTRVYSGGPDPSRGEGAGNELSDAYEAEIKRRLAGFIPETEAKTYVASSISDSMGVVDGDGRPVAAAVPGDPAPRLDRLVAVNTSIRLETSADFYAKVRRMDVMTRLFDRDRGPDIDRLLGPRLREIENAYPSTPKPFRADPQAYFRSKIEIGELEHDPYYFSYYMKRTPGAACPL